MTLHNILDPGPLFRLERFAKETLSSLGLGGLYLYDWTMYGRNVEPDITGPYTRYNDTFVMITMLGGDGEFRYRFRKPSGANPPVRYAGTVVITDGEEGGHV